MQTEPAERSFLTGNDVYCAYADAGVIVLQAPYEGTVSYGKGTAGGPAAIIRASEYLELYDIDSDSKPSDLGIATLPPLAVDGTPEEIADRVQQQVAAVLDDGKKPVLLGGEHSLTIGAVRAARAAFPDLGILQLDAHADLRDSYEGSPFSHACTMRRIAEMDIPYAGIGIRSMSEEEARFVAEQGIPVISPAMTGCGGGPPRSRDSDDAPVGARRASAASAIRELPDDVYVTVDIDVLDPSCMPATGTPEPGGLVWDDVVSILAALHESGKRVIGCDLVELAPIEGLHFCEYTAAKLAYKMIGTFWG